VTIPFATTTIRVYRTPADPTRDPTDDAPTATVVAQGVRAQISSPFGRERNMGGTQEIVEFSLSCDPVDLNNLDRVEDQTTAEMYEVVWARQRIGFGLDHTRAGLKQIRGVASSARII
jgi:hypothetical protein